MTKTTNCIGCSSFDEEGGCTLSIIPIRRTEHVPDCFSADPDSMAAKNYDGAEEGYKAVDAAIATMAETNFANEQPLFGALNVGVGKHVTDVSDENLHPLAGFLAGSANRLREALAAISTPHPKNTQGEINESHHPVA